MSKLKTFIPLDVAKVIGLLPPKSTLTGATMRVETALNGKPPLPVGVDLIWENDGIHTGRTYPVEYTLEKLSDQPRKKKG